MSVRYIVTLTKDEQFELQEMLAGGTLGVRKTKRAMILLASNLGATANDVAKTVQASSSTTYRTRKKFVEGGVEHALSEEPRPGAERKLKGKNQAMLVAIACSKPRKGRARWTLKLLANELVLMSDLEDISPETIRRRLKELDLKPWQKRMWCIPEVNSDFVACMEDVLDLYAQEPDPERPLVCFDETPTQLIGETRTPIAAKPGKTERIDYEYKRNGTANIFMHVAPHLGWRYAKVTKRKTKVDFAACMQELVDIHFPDAKRIRVVMDNLNTHRPAALYEAFEPEEARRILRKLEFHYTPKHGSWLNMAEIEIGIMTRQCLKRRIPDFDTLEDELVAWEQDRNDARATINWLFSVEKAREKLGKAYPSKSV